MGGVGMLLWLLLVGFLVLLVALVYWVLSANYDDVLDAKQLKSEGEYLDETGAKQVFPRLIEGSSVVKAELYISVVIPSYNERERLPRTLEDAISTLDKRLKVNSTHTWEIIVVDDGSRDK